MQRDWNAEFRELCEQERAAFDKYSEAQAAVTFVLAGNGALSEEGLAHAEMVFKAWSAATTSGLVLAACSGVRAHPILGLTTTVWPRLTKLPMPP